MTDVWGYADLHCHPMSHLGFGGKQNGNRLFWGAPTGAPATALACCGASHSVWRTMLPWLMEPGHGSCGYPDYPSWPTAHTIIHQQMYQEWIARAYTSGLRLLCALAVNNEYLPHLFHGGFHAKNTDSAAIGAQIAGMRRMVRANSGWMQIALSPDHARRIIHDGKLAIVLGIEVDSLGGWRRPQDTTDAAVQSLVDRLYRKGVRMMTPIHLANNAVGGCAITRDAFNILNHWLHRKIHDQDLRWWQVDQQATKGELRGVEYLLGRDAEDKQLRNIYPHAYRKYSRKPGGHINLVGLSARGETWIRRMMKRGMLVDVDHMSQHTRDRVLTMAEDLAYPLISTHSSFRDLGLARADVEGRKYRGVRNEGSLTRKTVGRIRDLGGMVAPITRHGPIAQYRHPSLPGFRVAADQDTSHSWAHAYLYAVEQMGAGGGVGIGSDFNGLAEQPRARFRRGRRVGPDRRIKYDVDRMVQTMQVLRKSDSPGNKRFNFNTEGLAHYGLLPDFVRDVANQYGTDDPLVPFFRSAQRFIETWQRCVDASAHV